MRVHWLMIGMLTGCAALSAQGPYPPYPQYPQGQPPYQAQAQYPQGPQGPPQAPQAQQGGAAGQPDGPVDEPGRAVARLGILTGDASIRRGDSTEWVAAAVNAPLMSGDQISVAAGGRAEVELDAAHFLRIGGDTELRLADIENGHYQVQVAHGIVTWRVLRDTKAEADISTPLVGIRPGPQSTVRIEVGGDGVTHVTVRHGEATVSTEKGSEKVAENTTMDVRGSMADPEFQVVAAIPHDEWDGWGEQRDNYLLRAQSQRYVTQDVQGVEDLDAYGHWNYDPAYGWVWMPTAVAANWAPYQNGQWVWEDYYGWTWVDYAPWGWAPFHYGYWYNRVGLGWAWYPGPRYGHIWWRPAMVGFFGWGGGVGIGVGFGFGNIGWVALAPHEIYHPWYGRGGFGGAGVFNAGVVRNGSVIGTFRNASVANGATAVSAGDFERGNFRNTIPVSRNTLAEASLVRGTPPVTPTSQNLRFTNRAATVQPQTAGASSRFYGGASNSASVRRTPFAQQQAAVRSAVSGQAQAQTPSRFQSAPAAQNRAGSPSGQSAAGSPNWQRFQSTPSTSNGSGAAASPRTATPSAGAAPGFSRYNGAQSNYSNAPNSSNSPRQVQVAPSIIRERPEAAPAQRGNYGGGSAAPRGAPAGGGSRGSAPHGNGRH